MLHSNEIEESRRQRDEAIELLRELYIASPYNRFDGQELAEAKQKAANYLKELGEI